MSSASEGRGEGFLLSSPKKPDVFNLKFLQTFLVVNIELAFLLLDRRSHIFRRCVMKRKLSVIPLVVLLASFLPGPLVPPVVASTCSSFSSFGFNFFEEPGVGPNITEDKSTGDTIRMTGSGSFDISSSSITASGSFTHTTASGALVARGTWRAHSFDSFMCLGFLNPGEIGGVLLFTATLVPDGGAPSSPLPATFTCKIGAPSLKDGVTIGSFTEIISGFTLFHANQ